MSTKININNESGNGLIFPINYQSFPVHIFPERIKLLIDDLSKKLQLHADFCAGVILFATSTAIGNKFKIQVKSTWLETAMLFITLVVPSGTNKTPVIKTLTSVYEEMDRTSFKEYQQQKQESNNDQDIIRKQVIIRDCTSEALISAIAANPNGLGAIYDELPSLFEKMGKYSNGKNGGTSDLLSIFSGVTFSTNRTSTKEHYITDPFCSIISGIQPSIISSTFYNQINNGLKDRFLWIFPPQQKRDLLSLEDIDHNLMNYYNEFILRIKSLNTEGQTIIKLSNEGFNQFNRSVRGYINDIINQSKQDSIKSIYAKLEINVLRMALIVFLMDGKFQNHTEIDADSILKATEVFFYFEKSALAVNELINNTKDPFQGIPEIYRNIYLSLPQEFNTKEVKSIISGKLSDRTVQNFLNNQQLFERLIKGSYRKKI